MNWMEQQVARRHPKRLQVRFHRVGERMSYVGYTANISRTGIFIGTIHPAPPNATVLIQFADLAGVPPIEGIVVHAARVSPMLRSVQRSGMGLKFTSPLENLEDLLRVKSGSGASVPFPAGTAESSAEPEPPTPRSTELESRGEQDGLTASAAWIAAGADRVERPAPPTVRREFESWSAFLDSYHREISQGALFVPNVGEFKLDTDVEVEILLPRFSQPVKVLARVVQCLRATGGSDLAAAGIGVVFADAPALTEWLQPFVDRIESGR